MIRPRRAVNLSLSNQVEIIAQRDVDGVGLVRGEYLVAEARRREISSQRVDPDALDPFVTSLAASLRRIAAAFAPRPVVYRSADLKSNEFLQREGA